MPYDDDDAVADKAADLIDELRDQLRSRELEIEDLQAELRRAQVTGVAVGVLMANEPGLSEADAQDAWDAACARFARGGRTKALAAYVVQTGRLPGSTYRARV